MHEHKKFPFTAYHLTRTCRVVPVQIVGPGAYSRDWAIAENGKLLKWAELHMSVVDAVTAGWEMIAVARKKIEQMEALQDERGFNLYKAAQRAAIAARADKGE